MADPRQRALEDWIQRSGIPVSDSLRVASADASARRYFRVPTHETTLIAMDAPPDREDTRPFVDIAHRLQNAGVHVPKIHAHEPALGFVVMTDLGDASYLDRMTGDEGRALMDAAVDALVAMQARTSTDALAEYDAPRLGDELDLFPTWYVGAHLGIEPDAAWWRAWRGLRQELIRHALEQPRAFVHRDYMPRNLMVAPPSPGVIDFQDALAGPITYDLASLLRDAFVSWDQRDERRWLERYRAAATTAGLPIWPSQEDFDEALAAMAAQRHLKVLGIFARLCYRDHKPHYIADAPRFRGYLEAEAQESGAVRPVLDLLHALEEGQQP